MRPGNTFNWSLACVPKGLGDLPMSNVVEDL